MQINKLLIPNEKPHGNATWRFLSAILPEKKKIKHTSLKQFTKKLKLSFRKINNREKFI